MWFTFILVHEEMTNDVNAIEQIQRGHPIDKEFKLPVSVPVEEVVINHIDHECKFIFITNIFVT